MRRRSICRRDVLLLGWLALSLCSGVPFPRGATGTAHAAASPRLAYIWRKGLTPSGLPTGRLGGVSAMAIDSTGDVLISNGALFRFSPSGTLRAAPVAGAGGRLMSAAPDSSVLVSSETGAGDYTDFMRYRKESLLDGIPSAICTGYCCTNCTLKSFYITWAMTIAADGHIYVLSDCQLAYEPQGCGWYGKLTVMAPSGALLWSWQDTQTQQERAAYPFALQEGPRGVLNVASVWRDQCAAEFHISRYTTDWEYLSDFVVPQLSCESWVDDTPWAAAFDRRGNAYIPLIGSREVVRYDPQGNLRDRWPLPIHLPVSLDDGYGTIHHTYSKIAIGPDSLIYVGVGNVLRPESTAVYVFSYDADGDSLLDAWEKYGLDGDDDGVVDYVLPGANPAHKDLYVEVDAMAGYAPLPGTLDDVEASFAGVPRWLLSSPNPDSLDGITLHADLDETALPVASWASEPWLQFRAFKRLHFGTAAERASPAVIAAKLKAVRYGPFVKEYGSKGSSGQAAAIPSRDFFVSLGGGSWPPSTRDEQGGTFMHELGHTLGLRHGGGDNINYKPNYFSVMNYLWQTPPRAGRLDGLAAAALTTLYSSWRRDFSRYERPPIDEDHADESAPIALAEEPSGYTAVGSPCYSVPGLAMLAATDQPVDWDRDNVPDADPVCTDANYMVVCADCESATPGQQLFGQLDWDKLVFLPPTDPVWAEAAGMPRASESPVELTSAMHDSLSRLRFDCNGNGVFDDLEIEAGTLLDANHNGIPDGCEGGATTDAPGVGGSAMGLRLWGAPNPSRASTELRFTLPKPGLVRLAVFDATGRRVRTLRDGWSSAGQSRVAWDGRDDRGGRVASGLYFVRLHFGGERLTLRVTRLE